MKIKIEEKSRQNAENKQTFDFRKTKIIGLSTIRLETKYTASSHIKSFRISSYLCILEIFMQTLKCLLADHTEEWHIWYNPTRHSH